VRLQGAVNAVLGSRVRRYRETIRMDRRFALAVACALHRVASDFSRKEVRE
jgi:hypothetical protein